VADLDGDGSFEVVVGTGLGLLYVLDAESGFVQKGFPMQFGSITSQIAVADIVPTKTKTTKTKKHTKSEGEAAAEEEEEEKNGEEGEGEGGEDLDNKQESDELEMVFGDSRGNLVCVSRSGVVLWDRQLPGLIGATPTIGDVDGDGNLDVVVTATAFTSGAALLFVVQGRDGKDLPNFPLKLGGDKSGQGQLSPSVLLVDLHERSAGLASPPLNLRAVKAAGNAAQLKDLMEKQERQKRLRGVRPGSSSSSTGGESSGGGDEEAEEAAADAAERRRSGGNKVASSPMGGWRSGGLHLVTPTLDGKLWVVEGGSGCLNSLEVGEHVYAMPLAEDLQGDGLVDLVVGTMSGELMAFGTSVSC
jgi:hypothetical protein